MRVERSTFSSIDGPSALTEPSSRSRRAAQHAADEFNSTTAADLLALFRGATGASSPASMERAEVVARLKQAYDKGVIQPDPDRIAAAILRNRVSRGD